VPRANAVASALPATLAVALALALPFAACGGGGGGATRAAAGSSPASAPAPAPATSARPVDLDPDVTGREILRLERTGPEPGAHDLLKYGSDGSAVIVQAYGGGGERIRTCALRPGQLARLRAQLDAALPLGPNRPDPPYHRISIYTNSAARYVLVAGATHASFNDDTMPRDARPLVRLGEDTLYGRAANCRTTYRSRVS
jgi:hypothetical protein